MDGAATYQAIQPNFSQPHPLGLPAHFSHPVGELGSGSFGRVYLCLYKPAAQVLGSAQPPHLPYVAVKVLTPLRQCDRKTLDYQQREAINQRRVNHLHVIGLIEVGGVACMPHALACPLTFRFTATYKHAAVLSLFQGSA